MPGTIRIRPEPYPYALRNPLTGFVARQKDGSHEWATLVHSYIAWDWIEKHEGDGLEKIRAVFNDLWRDVERHNIKVIPRVFLEWPGDPYPKNARDVRGRHWPADLAPGDYESDAFRKRLRRLVERLGQCWNDDPRVAFVEMGIVGKWGEHHSPSPTPALQKLLGDAFTRAFPDKQVMVRHPWEFGGFPFGVYWDSWAHWNQMDTHGAGIAKLGERWTRAPMGGEVAYDWGDYKVQPGDSPTDTVRDPGHRKFLIDSIRRLHGNHLRWVADYDAKDPAARTGAEAVQRAFGYRFVLEEVAYPARAEPGGSLNVVLRVRNDGSAPFYYRWPLEASLLRPDTRAVAWKATFPKVDLRRWLPGDRWDEAGARYAVAPKTYAAEGAFRLPKTLAPGTYVLALAVLDPAGMRPSLRFAVRNYFAGGRHPVGCVGVGTAVDRAPLDPRGWDNPAADRSLRYEVPRR